jgi:hypothetical protein
MQLSPWQLSAEGLDLIKRFEGFRGQRYIDAAGFPTIGYGHRIVPPESFPNGVSEAQAANLLVEDVSAAELAIGRLVKVALTQASSTRLSISVSTSARDGWPSRRCCAASTPAATPPPQSSCSFGISPKEK